MRHENPLGYLVALEGIALLRAFAGEHDREFTARRLEEVRRLLTTYDGAPTVEVRVVDAPTGYQEWARTYSSTANPAFGDEAVLSDLVADTAPTRVLDAACGTGRHSRWLVSQGHDVVGVDSSADMLRYARSEVPGATFLRGSLTDLPLDSGSVDVAICALALTHLPDLGPAIRELARVVRPGGRVLLADVHPDSVALGSVPTVRAQDGSPARIETYRHAVGDYLRSALASDLVLEQCIETGGSAADGDARPADELGPWDVWPWSLQLVVPEAAAAATRGVASLLILGYRKPGGGVGA